MEDRSSRARTSPSKASVDTTKRCVSLRIRLREGPVQLASRLGISPSTVPRILTTARLNRLSYLDRATGELVRRYEHPHPGSLVHVDVKKHGNIPDGGATSDAAKENATARPRPASHRANGTTPSSAPRSSTPSSTTTPAWHTRRCMTMRPLSLLSASCTAPSSGSQTPASRSSASCRTTAARTDRTCGATPASR